MTGAEIQISLVKSIRARLDRPVVMIGLMGAGKSRTGRMLADALDLPFTDADDEIEAAAGMKIADIFEKFGEPAFREGELKVMRRLISAEPKVIAAGGGAIMTPAIADLIWNKTVSVWVRAPLPLMLERTSRNSHRPLLKQGKPEDVLKSLIEKRYPVYGKADIIVDSHDGPAEILLDDVLQKLADFLSGLK